MAQQGGVDPIGNGAARTHSLAGPEGADGEEFGDEEGDDFGQQPQVGGVRVANPICRSSRAISTIRIVTTIVRRVTSASITIAMTAATDSATTGTIAVIGRISEATVATVSSRGAARVAERTVTATIAGRIIPAAKASRAKAAFAVASAIRDPTAAIRTVPLIASMPMAAYSRPQRLRRSRPSSVLHLLRQPLPSPLRRPSSSRNSRPSCGARFDVRVARNRPRLRLCRRPPMKIPNESKELRFSGLFFGRVRRSLVVPGDSASRSRPPGTALVLLSFQPMSGRAPWAPVSCSCAKSPSCRRRSAPRRAWVRRIFDNFRVPGLPG